jgi:hypothetical protein
MTGFEAYSIFNSLKLHFNQDSYDYFKYQGKTKTSIEAFENKKEKYFFYKLSRKFVDKKEYEYFLIANFLNRPKFWVGKLLEDDAMSLYRDRMKVIQSLTYTFKNDCGVLFENHNNPNDVLMTAGDYPILLVKALHREVSQETLIILNGILKFFPLWTKRITDTIRWPEYRLQCLKYEPFIGYNKQTYENLLRSCLKLS